MSYQKIGTYKLLKFVYSRFLAEVNEDYEVVEMASALGNKLRYSVKSKETVKVKEAAWLLYSLIQYTLSNDFSPTYTMKSKTLKKLFRGY